MPHAAKDRSGDPFVTRTLAPGVRLHLLRTTRFTTTWCRVALHRDLGSEATATSLLAKVLESATARHRTRADLAHALGDLYGASLGVGVEKLGDRQLLAASLEWPTSHVPRARGLLGRGLGLLREVLSDPLRGGRGPDAPLDREVVRTEQTNLLRALRALRDDKGAWAVQRALEIAFAGEPFALHPLGREEDVEEVTATALAALHAHLLARAPAEVYLVGDVGLREAAAAVRRHLLWPGRAPRAGRVPAVASVGPARARPRRVVEEDDVAQGKLVLAWRGPVAPRPRDLPAAETLAGVLGGGPWSRYFKVVREEHGLCYYAAAGWSRPKGLLLVQSGVDPAAEPRARRLLLSLEREVAGGRLEPAALRGFREAVHARAAALPDDRVGQVVRHQERVALGLRADLAAELAALGAVAPRDVRRVGRRLGLDTTFFLTARRRTVTRAPRRHR